MANGREIFIHGLEEDGQIVVPGCVRNGVSAEIASRFRRDDGLRLLCLQQIPTRRLTALVAVRTGWLKRHYLV